VDQAIRSSPAPEPGDPHDAARLLPLVYEELRRLAACRLAREPSGQTLQPTALVHEAYMRLVVGRGDEGWDGRGHFFAAAAEAMRRTLIENARRKNRTKHGGGRQRVELDSQIALGSDCDDLIALDAALTQLVVEGPQTAELVKLHFFAGQVLGLSPASAYRLWAYARAWLRTAVGGGGHVR
jgi:RNA polymerase sigma factor (TIGR02999 family)